MSKRKQTVFDKLKIRKALTSVESNSYLRKSKVIRILMIIITIAACTIFFTFHFQKDIEKSQYTNFTQGQVWHKKTLFAPHSFPIYKDLKQYSKEVQEIDKLVYPVYIFKKTNFLKTLDNFENLILNSTDLSSINSNIILSKIKPILIDVYNDGVISKKEEVKKEKIKIYIDEKKISFKFTYKLYDVDEVKEIIASIIEKQISKSAIIEIDFNEIILPNLIFSDNLTNLDIRLAKNDIPKTEGMINKGEIIIQKGERISETKLKILDSYYKSVSGREKDVKPLLLYISSFGHVFVIISLFLIYLIYIRHKIFFDNLQLLSINSLIFLVSLMAWISLEVESDLNLEYLILLPAFSMVAAIIFDSRTAFYLTVTMAFLVAGVRGNDYVNALMHLFAGGIAAYTVRDIQNRTQLFKSIFLIFIGYLIPLLVFNLEKPIESVDYMNDVLLVGANSLISPILTFGMIYVLEMFTTFSTDLKLKEYDNPNHPLMKKMNEVAPGTYQHSLNVAMLSERCAMAINANSIFCKVSSLYHDIGKMKRPEYFVENQIEIGNKHEFLSPTKSVNAIIEHVTYGVELAEKYNLPKKIIDIIKMHHGTSLVQYFYVKALENLKEGEEIDENNFRYPGPKPSSKEAAIVMICDTAEAISHIRNYSSSELDKIVQRIINDKIQEGQFDECDISLKDLQKIKFTVVKNILGISHKRIEYREAPKTIKTDYGI